MASEQQSLQEIIRFRKEKLQKLRTAEINPYPHRFEPTHFSQDILSNYEEYQGQSVTLGGRVMSIRKMGKAAFSHLEDSQGRIQIYIRKDDVGSESYDHFKLLDIGDIIGITGKVFKTRTGEISIHTETFTFLAKSIRPLPIIKEKDGQTFHEFSDKEQRYRGRHLDLIVNPSVKEVFRKRARIISNIRDYMDSRGFLEVETPILQPLFGGANARPFTTYHNTLDQKLYLRIADELYLKRLIIGGFEKVYELSKNFRNEGMDRNHNPEFTFLEFYQAYTDYEYMMDFVEDLFRTIGESAGKLKLIWGGTEIDLSAPFSRKPLFELLHEATGQDVSAASVDQLRSLCLDHDLTFPSEANYGQILDLLMKRLVEPKLVQPTFVIDYPKAISPLAKSHRSGDPNLVERFELFIGGAEFANAFTELNDPVDQRERLLAQADLREAGDDEAQPIDEDFLQAVECGMPPTGGVGVGIDRMVMLFTEQRWIKDVILFPALRPRDRSQSGPE